MQSLRSRLSEIGVRRAYVNQTLLPSWWDDEIAEEPNGLLQAAGLIGIRLGIPVEVLLNAKKELRPPMIADSRFKRSKNHEFEDLGFATAIARQAANLVLRASGELPAYKRCPKATTFRTKLQGLRDDRWVGLPDLIEGAWSRGIPIIYLSKVAFPTGVKKPDAIIVKVGGRPCIVICKQQKFPAWVAFYVAHELGHDHEGHLEDDDGAWIDLTLSSKMAEDEPKEELQANEYAEILLKGQAGLGLTSKVRLTGRRLAEIAARAGKVNCIDPGTLALGYGYMTSFSVANAALGLLPSEGTPPIKSTNQALAKRIDWTAISEDDGEWLRRITELPKPE